MKLLKYLGIFVLTVLIGFLIFVGISRLFLYNENSFDIPENFFDSRFEDRNFDDEGNGYKDLQAINDFIRNDEYMQEIRNFQGLQDYSPERYKELEDKFLYGDNYSDNFNSTKKKILAFKRIRELEQRIEQLSSMFEGLYKKDFIYSSEENLTSEKGLFEVYSFVRTNLYLADYYFQRGNLDKGIAYIEMNQNFIHFLHKKYDLPNGGLDLLILVNSEKRVLVYMQKSITLYDFSFKQKKNIVKLFQKRIPEESISIAYKSDHNIMYYNIGLDTEDVKGSMSGWQYFIVSNLFMSTEDSIAIDAKITYDVLSGKEKVFTPGFNIGNLYPGSTFHRSYFQNYDMLGYYNSYKQRIEKLESMKSTFLGKISK